MIHLNDTEHTVTPTVGKPSSEDLRQFALPYAPPSAPNSVLGSIGAVIGTIVFALHVINHVTLGLCVLWLIPLSLVGMIISAVAWWQSHKRGVKNGAASIGFFASLAPYLFSIMIPLYTFLFQFVYHYFFAWM